MVSLVLVRKKDLAHLLRLFGDLRRGTTIEMDGVPFKVEEYYQSKGFSRAQVEIVEGAKKKDRGVVLTVRDARGTPVRHVMGETAAGLHRSQ